MQGWGGKCPKPTTLWSNSRAIRKVATTAKARKGRKVGPLADIYVDRQGKRRYKGHSRLKKSQFRPHLYTMHVPCHFFTITYSAMRNTLREYPRGFGNRLASLVIRKTFEKEREPPMNVCALCLQLKSRRLSDIP